MDKLQKKVTDPGTKNILDDFNYPTDKPCIVVDIGHALTKCGVAGEFSPRWIVPSVAVKSRVGEGPLELIGKQRKVWEYTDTADLRSLLLDFFHAIYFRYLMVNPKERPVLIIESVLWPTVMRDTIADVLFNHFEVPSLLLAPAHLLALLPLGTQTGLVLDCGHSEALAVPVYHGVSVLKAWQAAPLGAKAVHENIRELLGETATVTGGDAPCQLSDLPDWQQLVGDELCEDVKLRACFVTRQERAVAYHAVAMGLPGAEAPQPAPSDFDLPLDGCRSISVPGKVRELACEPLHQLDADGVSLAALLLNAISACPIDLRQAMARNILLVGGTAMLPGFRSRLRQQLQELLQLPKYQQLAAIGEFCYHTTPAKLNYAAWLGGSLMAGLEAISVRAITRDQYKALATHLPDWTDRCLQIERKGLARP